MTTLTKTSDLLTAAALSREFDIDHMTAGKWLEESGLAAVVTAPYGRGFLRLYEPGPARDVIRARMPKPAVVEPAVASPAAPSVDLGVLEERIEALTEVVKVLQAQNRALFSYIQNNVGEPVGRLVTELGGVKP